MTNNFILFLNDTRHVRQNTFYQFCLHTHIDTKTALDKIRNKHNRKSQIVITTDISSIGYDLIDKETYNCNIFMVGFFNKKTGELISRDIDKYVREYVHPRDVLLRVLCLAKNNEIVQVTDKELRYGHSLSRLILGHHFDYELIKSDYKIPYHIRNRNKLLKTIYSLYGKNK